jgi:hypothetical protein
LIIQLVAYCKVKYFFLEKEGDGAIAFPKPQQAIASLWLPLKVLVKPL